MADRLSEDERRRLRDLADALRDWHPAFPSDRFSGRGIVIAAGGTSMFTNAYVLVSILRQTLGCRLPIEVWHFGAAEMSASMASLLTGFGVELVDAEPIIARENANIRDGWQLKPFAMLWSRFAEVLLLDADEVPVSDPAACFDWPEYRDAGAVFWPDKVDLTAANEVWADFDLPPCTTASVESGQLLVDKRRHWRALAIVVRLNEAADLLYRLIYGDKDTFLVGWTLAEAAYAMVPHRPFADDRVLTQVDFSRTPLFQHCTSAKWRYGGEQHSVDNFVHFDACLAAIGLLRRRWNGRVFHAPDRSVAAREAEAALVSGGALTLEVGRDERLALELLPFGEIGAGRAPERQNWWCEEAGGEVTLCLAGVDGSRYRLARINRRLWTGFGGFLPAIDVVLMQPVAPADPKPAPGLVEEMIRAARLGTIDADEAALANALALLQRIEPGTEDRLRAIAATAEPPARAALQRVIGRLGTASMALQPPTRNISVFRTGYRPASDGEPA